MMIAFSLANEVLTQDYSDHYCIRDCSSTQRKNCIYNFTVDWFMTMSNDCLNCPTSLSDCFNPGCISADGYNRPIRAVNKLLPGPTIQVCQYDTITVNVYNKLNDYEAMTIHWHGLFQRGPQYMVGKKVEIVFI